MEGITIEKINIPKISGVVLETFFKAISEGEIKIGETLASERELCEKLNISRGSLREGLSILEFLGVISSQGNRKVVTSDYALVQTALSIIQLTDKKGIIQEYIEYRRDTELLIIKLACERATDEDLEKINRSIDLLETSSSNIIADEDFHMNLAAASHNSFLIYIDQLLYSMLINLRSRILDFPGRKKFMVEEHKLIYEFLVKRDVEKAQQAMLTHLFFMEKTITLVGSFQ